MNRLILELHKLMHSVLYFVAFLLIWIAVGFSIATMAGLLANAIGFEFASSSSILVRVGAILMSLSSTAVLLRRFWKCNPTPSALAN